MKKCFSIIFVIILIVTCIISLVACNKNGQTVSTKDLGTYYKVDGTDLDPDSFIELKSGNKWYDGEFEGKFTIKDGKITLYDGDDELMSGTVSDGVLTLNFMGMKTVYKKGTPSSKVDPTPTPHPSNEFTVTFYLNDGTKNSKTKQTENELITYTPERIGYIFNGWWISSGKTETDEPILTKRWDMSQKVEDNELILYAEWVLAPTQDAQLPAPSVSVDGYRYSWERINNAESYNVILKKGYDVIEEQKTYDTYWNFSQFYESGTYTLSVRANGDGIKSINSSYTTKHISHRILGELSFCNFDKSTSTLTWGVVEGATSYDIYVDGLCILEDTNEKSFVLTNVDAGNHTVVVKGKKENWQTSYNSYSIYKDMLKTPGDFRSYFDYDNMEYVLEWDSVRGVANSEIIYKVYNGTSLIKQAENNFYKIPRSDWASGEKTKNITVVAFDKNAETIQSIPTDKLEIKRMVAFEVESNLEYGGTYDIAINASDIKVTFNYNYKDCPDNKIQVLNKDNPAIEYFTPVRDGYVFLGWYKDKQCIKRFDFSSTVKSDITLFALWQDIDEKTTVLELNKEKKVYTSRTAQKFSFVPMKAGTFTLGYYNNGSGQRTNINVYQGISTVYAPGYQTSTSWVIKKLELNAYDMVTISITSTSDNYSGYFTFKMEGDALPDVNPDNFAVVKKDNKIIAPVDSELSFTAKPSLGYNCLGWYDNNDKQLSSQADCNTKLSLSSSAYTVKWAINKELKDCVFTSTADTCVITGITDKTITEFVVPDYVTGIGDEAFKDCTKLSSITIGKNVTSIGNGAFLGCPIENATMPTNAISYIPKEKLTTAVINGGESIAQNAFKGCSGLTSVTIDNSVTSIGENAFYNCYSLIEVYNKSSLNIVAGSRSYGYVGYYAKNVYKEGDSKLSTDENGYVIYTDETENEKSLVKYAGNDVELSLPNGITSIHKYAFYGCTGLTSINIPNGVTSIGDSAFSGCTELSSVTIGNSVTSIGNYTFYECTGLTSVTIGYSVTSIGSYAFNGCTGLTSITIPNNVTSVGNSAFKYCSNLATVNWNATNCASAGQLSAGQYRYLIFEGCSKLVIINIGNNVTTIPAYAFAGCTTIKNITIPNSVTSIGGSAFSGCTGLTSITIPNSVTSIGDSAFSGCTELSSVTIGNSVTSIGNYAFYGCTGLTSITIPDSVTSIGNSTFQGCTGLTSITIPDSVTSIGGSAFSGCSSLTIYCEASSKPGGWDFNWNYSNCSVIWGCQAFGTTNDWEWVQKDDKTTIFRYIGNNIALEIPATINGKPVTSIGNYAFYGCSGLTSITIPNSVTSIGESAFYGCTGLTSITIPNSVISIGSYAFYGCSGLTSITIPNSVTSIGNSAFFGCPIENATMPTVAISAIPKAKLTKVVINGGESIRQNAFKDCIGLTSITIPDSVTSIVYGAFDGCPIENATMPTVAISAIPKAKLTKVVINGGESIRDSAFKDCRGLTSVTIGNSVTSIGNYAFYGCKVLTTITIPDSVTSIGNSTFQGCTGLTSITIPDSVTSIGDWAFNGCTGLTDIVIPDSVTSIGTGAFQRCERLTSITIGNSVTSIGNSVFLGCPIENATMPTNAISSIPQAKLTTVVINGGESIGNMAFKACTGLTSITIPDSVTSIGGGAFSGCTGLTSVTIPDSVTSIGNSAFSGCSGLTSVTIPDSVTNIGDWAFKACTGLTSITIPDSVTSIGNSAFSGCSGLTSVTIPNSVTNIGDWAFSCCTGFNSITIPNSVTSIGNGAFKDCSNLTIVNWNATSCASAGELNYPVFSGCSNLTTVNIADNVIIIPSYAFKKCIGLTSVTIPNSVTSIGSYAFDGCNGLTSIYYNGNVAGWCGISGLENLMNGSRTLYIGGNKVEGELGIPNSVASIGNYAFNGCIGLTSVVISDSVTSIGNYAFNGCTGLASVVIPDRVTSIGDSAFYGCTGLTSITIGNSVTSIGERAFYGCTGLTSITIPDSVISIGYRAFYNCTGLTSVTIGNSVTSIGNNAFYGCTGLTSITIGNSVTSIGDWAFRGCNNLETVNWNATACTSAGDYFNPIFDGCSKFTTVNIGNNVTTIPDEAFKNCSSVTNVNYTGDMAGWCAISGLRNIPRNTDFKLIIDGQEIIGELVIPDSVTSIGESAFKGCTGLTSITIPASVTSIGEYAFRDCSSLKINCEVASKPIGWNDYWNSSNRPVVWGHNNITANSEYDYVVHSDKVYLTKYKGTSTIINIPNLIDGKDVVSFGEIFKGNTNIKEVTIPASVTSIGYSAFEGCNLETIEVIAGNSVYYSEGNCIIEKATKTLVLGCKNSDIPDSVISIGYRAFYGCTGLTSITIGNSVTTIGSGAFLDCTGLTSITIGNSVTTIGSGAFRGCTGLTSITIGNSVTTIGSGAFRGCSSLTSVTIPEGVTSIGNHAFFGCTGLTSVTIGNRVTSIGDSAFQGCEGLTSITIPASVTSIGYSAFEGCNLETIEVIAGNSVYYSEGNCIIEKATKTLVLGCKNSDIPDSVKSIGEDAFHGCTGLTSITIPKSVTSIGSEAFSVCTSLGAIFFKGTKAQWQSIKKGNYWNFHVPSYCQVVCTDGTVSI